MDPCKYWQYLTSETLCTKLEDFVAKVMIANPEKADAQIK